ncbi:MAG: cytochrome c3 family protein [Candidatus Ozemobacteraceae bacterium]
MQRLSLGVACLLVLLATGLLAGTSASPAQESRMGRDTCMQCHEGIGSSTVHFQLSPKYPGFDKLDCENCHTQCESHVTREGASATVRVSVRTMKATCRTCHPLDKTLSTAWNQGTHNEQTDKDCFACHTFHNNANPSLLKAPKNELCLSCHQDVRAEFARPYKHPLADGQVECTSCHDPHADSAAAGKLARKQPNCISCHSEVRGPFMWEHKATRNQDACMNCHNPHGGTSRKLLKTSDNQLCLNCHQAELLLSDYLPDGDRRSKAKLEHTRVPQLQGKCAACHGTPFIPVVGVHTSKVPNTDCTLCHASIRGIDHTRYITSGRCIDCHTDIHGSNHNRAFLD